jgi:hypothetical protein
MVRKQIYIHKRQDDLIKRLAGARGVSEAEVIRHAIEKEMHGSQNLPVSESISALDEFIQLALSKRASVIKSKAYRWNRDEIYEERLSRWLSETDEKPE